VKGWLGNFAYKVNIDLYTFFITGMTVILIAAITIAYNTLRAALANPVEALKYE